MNSFSRGPRVVLAAACAVTAFSGGPRQQLRTARADIDLARKDISTVLGARK